MQEGQEEKEEEKDDNEIAEEEEGIEMSDDFEGRMHDEDPNAEEEDKSDSDKEEEEDEAEPDDKMGDLDGMNEETVDEKFWGDSDDEDENEKQDEEDDKGKGADGEAESELVAKDEHEGENILNFLKISIPESSQNTQAKHCTTRNGIKITVEGYLMKMPIAWIILPSSIILACFLLGLNVFLIRLLD